MIFLILAVLMFMSWAIGGEDGFGKGKRGLLLAIPMSLYGLMYHMVWWLYPIQVLGLWGLYQSLFYGKAIAMVYDNHNSKGWWLVALNGALIGLTPLVLAIAVKSWTMIPISIIICTLGFMWLVLFSNDSRYLPIRVWISINLSWKFRDAWFDCEGMTGVLIAIAIWLGLL